MKIKEMIKTAYQPTLFVFVAFFVMVLVSYLYVSDIVRKQMLIIGEESMNTTESAVTSLLSEASISFANIAQTAEAMLNEGRTNEEIYKHLSDVQAYYSGGDSPIPDFMKVYGYIRGDFLDATGWVPTPGFMPTLRPWYLGASKAGNSIYFSEPYIDADTGGIIISFSQRLVDSEGSPYGILAIDLHLTRITDYVMKQRIANNGYGVALSDSLTFAAHKDAEYIGMSVYEMGEGFSKLGSMLQKGETIAATRFIDIDGTDSVAYFRTIFTGWHIGVITPRASYYGQVYAMGIVLGALGFVLMLALSFLLVRTRVEKLRADEESRSKSSFLARMSHEMRTPMNAIIGMTRIARETDDIERIRYCLTKIDDASGHLLGVINDVLDISKIEAGRLELSETNCAFADVIDQVSAVVDIKIQEKKQNLTIDIDPEIPDYLFMDRQRLAQVITNLLSNANKFTPEGGNITLATKLSARKDDLVTLEVRVSDDGIGIDKEQQARLFRSFEQADGSISRRYGGTGLGLAISKRIIEAMNGEIGMDSDEGQGASFWFTVRLNEGYLPEPENTPPPELPEAPADEAASFDGKRILLAEDVLINQEILLALLEDSGLTIDVADNGRIACEKFEQADGGYDLIFMDIHMPEVDGYEATRRIRASGAPNAATIPIVAMSANVFREDIEKCLEAGMNDHVGKPIEMDDVWKKLSEYIGETGEREYDG